MGPFAIWGYAFLLALLSKEFGDAGPLNWLVLAAAAGAGLVELIAVPIAIFLLVRVGPYVTAMNIAMTMVAAIPVLLLAFVVLALIGPNARLHM